MSQPTPGVTFSRASLKAAVAIAGSLALPCSAAANVLDPALYVRSSDGAVYEKKLQSSGWGAWNSLGKPSGHQIVSDVALNVGQQGEKQLFAIGEDGHIYVTYEASGYASGWHPWSDFGLAWGGGFKGSRVTPFTENGWSKVAAISGGGNPFLNYSSPAGWAGWSPISLGVGFRNLTVNNHADGHAELYGVGDDLNVYSSYVYSGGWHPLSSMGKPYAANFVSGLAANTGVSGENQLFGVGDDGYMWASYQTPAFPSGWHPWYRMPRGATGFHGNVATFRGFDGRIGTVVRGLNETAYNIVAGDSTPYPIGYLALGKAFASDISANRHLEGGTNQLFALGSDGDVYQTYQVNGGSSSGLNNGWHPWYSIGKLPAGSGSIQGNIATFPGGTRMVNSEAKTQALISLLRSVDDNRAQVMRNGLWAAEAAELAQATRTAAGRYGGPNVKVDTPGEADAVIADVRQAATEPDASALLNSLPSIDVEYVQARMPLVGMAFSWGGRCRSGGLNAQGSQFSLSLGPDAKRVLDTQLPQFDAVIACLRAINGGGLPSLRMQLPIDAMRRTELKPASGGNPAIAGGAAQIDAFRTLLNRIDSNAQGVVSIMSRWFERTNNSDTCATGGASPESPAAALGVCKYPTQTAYRTMFAEIRSAMNRTNTLYTAWNEPDIGMFQLRYGDLATSDPLLAWDRSARGALLAGRFWAQAASVAGADYVLAGEFGGADAAMVRRFKQGVSDATLPYGVNHPSVTRWALHEYNSATLQAALSFELYRDPTDNVSVGPMWLTEVGAKTDAISVAGGLGYGQGLLQTAQNRKVRAYMYHLMPQGSSDWDSALLDSNGRARPVLCGLGQVSVNNCSGT